MDKKNYLSRGEQIIWEYIKEKEIIDTELITLIFPEMNREKINKILHSLYKKEYIKRAEKDIYYTNQTNLYGLALKINKGYIALTSALKFYGLTEYEDFTIYVITKKKYKTINLKNYTIKYLKGNTDYTVKKEGIVYSCLEKTFFDCFSRIKYIDYNTLTKALYDSEINWELFLEIFNKGKICMKQRTGFVLYMLKKKTDFKVPDYVLNELKKDVKHPIKIGSGIKSKYYIEWKVQLCEDIINWWG